MHGHENEGEAVLPTPGDNPESDKEDDTTHEQQVQEALQNIPSIHGIEIELRPCDVNEEELVAQFVATGCSCVQRRFSFCTQLVKRG